MRRRLFRPFNIKAVGCTQRVSHYYFIFPHRLPFSTARLEIFTPPQRTFHVEAGKLRLEPRSGAFAQIDCISLVWL